MVFPKRLLLFFSPDGTSSVDHNGMVIDWKPQGTETAFTLHSIALRRSSRSSRSSSSRGG